MFECIDKAVLFGFVKIAVSIKLATYHLDVCLVIYSAYENAAFHKHPSAFRLKFAS